MQVVSKDERNWAMLIHLSGLAGYFIPFGNLIAPFILWMIKKDQSPYIDDQGKEAINFQISITLYAVISIILILLLIGIAMIAMVGLFGLVFIIIAAIKANEGVYYRYPLTLRLVK